MKCPNCKSTSIEYYPDVDGASWVRHIYVQKNGEWKIKVFSDEDKDVSTIQTPKIFGEDMMPYMYCSGCTAEFHGKDGK